MIPLAKRPPVASLILKFSACISVTAHIAAFTASRSFVHNSISWIRP
uniref:Uncharacterized protein n=1 Tax=Siphoviridae sp. ctTrD1 TaxID=2825524 RepID=A0A8S5PR86_9CAUD|nr:MAG TPA: hypothetical protein [Siphoviridae sp. ctTrD1]